VLVRWQPPVSGSAVRGCMLERTTNAGAPEMLNTAVITRRVFTDELVPAAQLCYIVTALNMHGDPGTPTAPACVDLRDVPPPDAPFAVTAELLPEAGRARIAWRAPAAGSPAAQYAVHRRLNAGNFALFGTVPVPDTTLVDSTLTSGTWCYYVRALDAVGAASAPSDTACVTYSPASSVGPPLDLIATPADTVVAGNANGAVVLSFDEGSGQLANDTSGNGNHATLGSSDVVDTADPVWVAGRSGSAMRFDGSNDRLKILDSPTLRLNSSFTVEAWVLRASTTTEDCIASKGDSNKRNFNIMILIDGRIEFQWESSGGVDHGVTSTATITDNNWHHVACVYDQASARSRIFLDGLLVQSIADSGTPTTSSDPMYVGARTTAGTIKSQFHGTIDLVRVAPGALYADNFTPPLSYHATMTLHTVQLQWQPPGTGVASGYRVYRQDGGGSFVAIGPPLVAATSFVDMAALQGAACYRVTAFDASGLEGAATDPACTGAVKAQPPAPATPVALSLYAAPNPFNPTTTFHFMLPQAGDVSLVIYDVRGARVATLVQGKMPAGTHTVRWTGRIDAGAPAASGVYFARLQAGGEARNTKLLLLK
jgi:hypothetical protein